MMSDDKMFGDTVPCEEDTCLNNDEFDTQVVDDDIADVGTQAVCFGDETQILEVAGGTQVMEDDEHTLADHMDTQRLDIPNSEDPKCDIDGEGSERTEVLDDTVVSKFLDTSCGEATSSAAKATSQFCQSDGGTQSESLLLDNVPPSSGSLGRGFASVRTASLRAAGLAARQSALKNADNGSSKFSSLASKRRLSNDGSGMSNIEAVGLNDVEYIDEDALSDEDRNVVVRSLARKLFLKENVAEMGSDDNACERREDLFQWPCDNDVAGLSYVDSQEPGELSQANALNFVDNFLKFSVFESGVGAIHDNAVAETASPSAIAKGAHSIAKKVGRKSTLARGSIFEWDDDLEDEGGGEFFTKKKEELLGTISRTHKSCPKPWSSNYYEPKKSQSVSNLQKDKRKQNSHDTVYDLFHCDLKSVNGGQKGIVKEVGFEKLVDSYAGQQRDLASCSQEALNNSRSVDIHDVGIDTQMAAEAIEALSAGNLPENNCCSIADDQVCQSESDRTEIETKKNCPLKHSKQNSLQASGIATRSRSKRNVQSHGQSVMKKFDVGIVNSRTKRSRLIINDSSPIHGRESSRTEPGSVDGKQTKGILRQRQQIDLASCSQEALNNSRSVDIHNVGIDTQMAAEAIETLSTGNLPENNCCSIADDQVCQSERDHSEIETKKNGPLKHSKQNSLQASGVATRSRSKRNVQSHGQSVMKKFDVGIFKSRTKRSRLIINDSSPIHGRESSRTEPGSVDAEIDKADGSVKKRGVTEHASIQDIQSSDKGLTSSAYRGPFFTFDTIARRTRSRKSAVQCAECPRNLSLGDTCQLSSKKQDACSSPVKGTLGSVTIGGSPANMKQSANPIYITPVNLKTPRSTSSPICVGDGYYSPSCKKSLSLQKEFMSLIASEPKSSSPFKGLRQRRDIKNVRILFSQHLDDDIVRQQKKILSRLGVSLASSISEASHFVADKFVRTRNMLEAIANAKPVVTHLWLESCGQANCFIDEKSYILRDANKEKELGFSMAKSLVHASQHPLLEGKKVLITPNVKPAKEVISSLVKAVHGQAVERLGRSTANDELFVLSCEEDFGVCVPLLEKGIAVYSSEMLMNGIITQRLEYERYRLFLAPVKKTRSTSWLNKSGGKFLPVNKIM